MQTVNLTIEDKDPRQAQSFGHRNDDGFTNIERMHILTVKSILKEKIITFDLTATKVFKGNAPTYFVSGGCIGSLLRSEEPNDYDVYFYSDEIGHAITRLYKDDPSYQNQVAVVDKKYREVSGLPDGGKFITENATTLKSGVQLITRHYGTPDKIRRTFDFVHCMPYYDRFTDKLNISKEQYDLNMNKKMKLNKGVYQTYRQDKFLARGWTWQ